MERNPFAINFGKIPSLYISRDLLIDEIIQELTADEPQIQCFMLTGTRGSGKTVTMTAIEKTLADYDEWIIVRLNPARDMLEGLVGKLYDSKEYISNFVNTNLNLSKFGIGIGLEKNPPVADIESALEIILKEIKRRNKRLLITVDEVSNTGYMKQFASSFQIMIRQDFPVFLLMAGLYENISELENEKDLTFLYRTPKYEMEPLNLTLIAEKYRSLWNLSSDEAMEIAISTKGYPFAYQVFGKYLWEEKTHKLTPSTLAKIDEALSHYVYAKIWSELSAKDRWFMSFIVQKDTMATAEILELSAQKKNEFSQYRARLRDKGLINVSERGFVSCKLPRFDKFIKDQQLTMPLR